MRQIRLVLFIVVALLMFQFSIAQTSTLVSVGSNGKLVYTADSKGNKVPDFSGVGYMNSESPIPTVGVVRIVNAVSGDNLSNVQTAINEVAALPLDANGFRGAILFKAGKYLISDSIKINASGIVLRGEGKDSTTGTHFVCTKTAPISLFYFSGNTGTSLSYTSRKAITNPYVPFGTNQVTVASGHTFVTGDKVMLHRIPKQSWVDLLTMAQWGWTYSAYDVYVERKVAAVNGNTITLDAPIVDHIDTAYATAELMRYTSSRPEKCGIENMCISSTYASETDENHGWEAVTFFNIINSWAKDLDVYYFGYAAVHVLDGAAWITVQDCRNIDPKSLIDGGRRYSFNVDGQRSLVQNCFTRGGRHDFVNGSRSNGPVVFYNCSATNQFSDIGPHHRWSTGILYDNIFAINGRIDVQNRTSSGSGHGWAGAEIMFWNCEGDRMVLQDPQGDNVNWAIGCVFNQITNVGDMTTEPLGIVESSGTHISAIPSLFMKQLVERLEPLRQVQTISFPSFAIKQYNDSDFFSNASTSSGLTVNLTSSNTNVATILNGMIHIVGVGTSIITASQPGNMYYLAASSATQTLTVNKANQSIIFPSIPSKNIGDADFSGGATSTSGLAITYSSSNTAVATIVNGNIRLVGAGVATITAAQSGNATYMPAASITQSLTVSKSYTYTPSNITVIAGSIGSGVAGNLATNNSSYVLFKSTTTNTRVVDWYGSVFITQAPSTVNKLTINYDGKLSASKTQILYLYNWATASWVQVNSRSVSTTDVLINSIQTLPANYISANKEIRLRVYSTGGTANYTCSGDWLQFIVQSTSATKNASTPASTTINNPDVKNIQLYPNPSKDIAELLYELIQDASVSIALFDANGNLVKNQMNNVKEWAGEHRFSLQLNGLKNGVYFVKLTTNQNKQTIKLVINN